MSYNSGLSPDDIRDIFDTGLGDSALSTWISAAEGRVGDLPDHDELSDSDKKDVTKFLSAALATAQDPRVDREQHESATVSYGGERMRYIEVAAMLDPTNTIATDNQNDASIGTFEVK